MARVARIIGIVIVMALPIWAYRAFDGAVSASTEAEAATDQLGETVGAGADDRAPDDLAFAKTDDPAEAQGSAETAGASDAGGSGDWRDVDGEPPRYLAFGPAKEAREARPYRVGDAPDVIDDDEEPNVDRSTSYPPETDLATGYSLGPVEDIEPGLYASSFEAKGCSYELRRIDRSGEERLIGQERLPLGRLLVSINPIEPDLFTSVPQCLSWSVWSPLVEPLVTAGVGDYWIGDLASGEWSVPEGCLWEKVVAFRGARLADVTDSGRGPEVLVVDEDTIGLRIRDCSRPLRLTEAELVPGLGLEPGLEP